VSHHLLSLSWRRLTPRIAATLGVLLLLFSVLAACADAEVAGRELVVAPSGDDANPGTVAAPFRTVAKGLASVRPGDTLLVRGGTYPERIRSTAVVAGTAAAPIVVRAWPGERPVVEGLLWLKGASYWTVDGINVTWGAGNASTEHMVKFTDGVGWAFRNAEVWGARSFAGVLVAGNPSGWSLDHLYVHDTYDSGNGTNKDHLIYVNAGVGGGVIERNLLVGSENGRAVKIGPADPLGPTVDNVIVRYNTMYENLGPSAVQVGWNASNNQVYRNIMVKGDPRRAAVTSFELTGLNNEVRDNLVWQVTKPVETTLGLLDRGGNVMADPGFVDVRTPSMRATSAAASAYGHLAPGDDRPASTTTTVAAPVAPTTTSTAAAPTTTTTAVAAPSAAPAPAPAPTSSGDLTTRPTVKKKGYRMVASDGGIFSFGDAGFFGSTGAMRLNQPILGMASTPSGQGYWLTASDGGIFSFGDAEFFGSTGDIRLNRPITAMTSTPTGRGYWLTASDGGIFAFGDAEFFGSTGDRRLPAEIAGMAAAPDGRGYWLAGADGSVYAFGSAPHLGDARGAVASPVTDIARSGGGYWLATRDGAVHSFGDAEALGSMAGTRLSLPVVGMASVA